jgi:hypothetical protein
VRDPANLRLKPEAHIDGNPEMRIARTAATVVDRLASAAATG